VFLSVHYDPQRLTKEGEPRASVEVPFQSIALESHHIPPQESHLVFSSLTCALQGRHTPFHSYVPTSGRVPASAAHDSQQDTLDVAAQRKKTISSLESCVEVA
jgi:hypothetical protein